MKLEKFLLSSLKIFIFVLVFSGIMIQAPLALGSVINIHGTFNSSGSIEIKDQMSISHSPAEWDYHANNLKVLGPRILRNNIEWFRCARDYGKESMLYNFSYYERMLENLKDRGIEFLGDFVYGWGWWPNSYDLPRSDWPYYFDFVASFCEHFKDNITYYETWNEPDIGFWTGTDDDFFEFLSLLTAKIKENDPTSVILSPGISGPNVEYLEKMILSLGVENFNEMFDIVAYHAYCGTNGEYLSQKIDDVQAVLDKYDIKKEKWITEIGLSTSLPSQDIVDDFKKQYWDYQATQVLKIYSQSIDKNISATFWYCQNDWCDVGDTHGEGRFGLMYCKNATNYTYGFKPAGFAYNQLSQLISNGTYYPLGISLENKAFYNHAWAYYFYTPRNTTVLVLWSQGVGTRAKISVEPSISEDDGFNQADYGKNQVEFQLKMIDYFKNSTMNQSIQDFFDTKVNSTPLLLELNYSGFFNKTGLEPRPLLVHIDLYRESTVFIIVVIILSLLAFGLAYITFSFIKQRDPRAKKRKIKDINEKNGGVIKK
ncbi:MAG: hypothetical protein ACTSYS_09310 [Promethearchaeota archaeon]